MKLLSPSHFAETKHVSFEHIKANFVKIGEKLHEVVLEINSQKFFIHIKTGFKKLEQFEIIAVKWFLDLWVKVVHFLKKLVTALYFEY